ncbi:MAG: GNAT family N-acetyltransferase [Nocardiopsaceae bacterium]|nr:GNAT family N-acetyltransferase [Nocardiopsaceae bacterium]
MDEIESLYFAAFHGPPLYESREAARSFAQLYGWLLPRPDLVTVFSRTRQGAELAGIAYGHPWRWAEQSDEWAAQLRERLGESAASLEGRFAVYLLAVDPGYRGKGLGRLLLRSALEAAGAERAWLITRDEQTPAMALYTAEGWVPVGQGPDTPNGRPGLVLIKG